MKFDEQNSIHSSYIAWVHTTSKQLSYTWQI